MATNQDFWVTLSGWGRIKDGGCWEGASRAAVMEECLIGFGANQGDREAMLARVLRELAARGFRECRSSRLYQTRPIGGPAAQGEYGNAAIRARTPGDPREVVRHLLDVEAACGRKRTTRWAPRVVDLDLLLLGQRQIDEPDVSLPHPRMLCRRFVLEPACEVAADLRHPWSGASLGELAAAIGHSTPGRAVWLWPNFFAAEQQLRWRALRADPDFAAIAGAELEIDSLARADAEILQARLPGRGVDQPAAVSVALGATAEWHVLIVSDPLQFETLSGSPSLVVGWQPQATAGQLACELAAREAVRRHRGAVLFVDGEAGQTGCELAAALRSVAEFWRAPVWPHRETELAAGIRPSLSP